MAKKEDAAKAMAKTKMVTIRDLIQKSLKELGRALPAHLSKERLERLFYTTIRKNPKLMECQSMSLLGALFQCAQTGLELDVGGQAFIIPYGTEAVFQIGYPGYASLFYRHEASSHLEWGEVCEKDEFDYEKGTNSHLKHKVARGDRGKPTHYWVMAHLQNGGSPFEVMTVEECHKHGKRYSKAYSKKDSPWQDAHGSKIMCLKTVLIQLTKIIPTSVEIQKAVMMDNTIKSEVSVDMTDIKDETDYTEVDVEVEDKKDDPKEEVKDENQTRIEEKMKDEGLYDEEGD